MAKVSRADWAPPTPWNQIPDKPTIIGQRGPTGPAGPTGPTGPSATGVLPPQFTLTWDIPEMLPLQTATETFNVNGVFPGYPLVAGVSLDLGFCWFKAVVTDIDIVTLYALNMDGSPVTLGEVTFTLQRFN